MILIGPPNVNFTRQWDGTIEPVMKKIVKPIAVRHLNVWTAS